MKFFQWLIDLIVKYGELAKTDTPRFIAIGLIILVGAVVLGVAVRFLGKIILKKID